MRWWLRKKVLTHLPSMMR
jgi:hypothetical protein